MTPTKAHALVVDDDKNSVHALAELVEREGFTASIARTLAEAREQLWKQVPNVILIDLMLPDGSGTDLLADLDPNASTQVVVITGHASVDTAVNALRGGATDYLTKPLDIARLKTVLANVARTAEMQEEISRLRAELRGLGRFGPLVGVSQTMQSVYNMLAKVAPTDATILLVGESGSGKDLVAQTVHDLSKRRRGPFLPVNCGAISGSLFESELFGHERGSFTGAERTHRGHFERASGGTLFLDEITETPIEFQVKLLRVLETATITRVGGERPITIDARVIAATNRTPEQAVAEGKLREDLYYRLKVFSLQLPPLRKRPEDIPLLAQEFVSELNTAAGTAKRLSTSTLDRLRAYGWPGNVRQLKNVVQHAFILAGDEITVESLPIELQGHDGIAPATRATNAVDSGSVQLKVGTSLAEAERRLILATLSQFDNDKKKAAEALGVSLKTLYNRLNVYKEA